MLDIIKFLMIIVMLVIILFDTLAKINNIREDFTDSLFLGLVLLLLMDSFFVIAYILNIYTDNSMSKLIIVGIGLEFIFLLICYSELIKLSYPTEKQTVAKKTIKIN